MADEFELMKELAAAAEPCFDTADRVAIYCEMNLGALPHAVDELISAVVREDHPMPAGLIHALKEWMWAFTAASNYEPARQHYRRRREHGDRHAAPARHLFNKLLG